MTNITLSAGSLSVDVSGDEPAEELASVAHSEMAWMMQQWTQIDGEMVNVSPQAGFHFG